MLCVAGLEPSAVGRLRLGADFRVAPKRAFEVVTLDVTGDRGIGAQAARTPPGARVDGPVIGLIAGHFSPPPEVQHAQHIR